MIGDACAVSKIMPTRDMGCDFRSYAKNTSRIRTFNTAIIIFLTFKPHSIHA